MTGDHADGSRKGMRAIPLTQRQRKQLKPTETPTRLTDAAAPHTSGDKHRVPRRRAKESAAPRESAAPAPRARATTPKPATTAAPPAPARASRRPTVERPAELPAPTPREASAPAPRRTLRRPPPSITPVSPLDLVDTAPLVAPASLRSRPAAPEPELAETTRLKLPRGASGARGAATPVEQIDAVDTTHLTPVEDIVTTHLPPALDAVDTAPLASLMRSAPAPELAATTRLRRAAAKAAPPAGALDDVETAPLALGARPMGAAIDAVDTIDTTQLTPPIDAVDTTQLVAPETPHGAGDEPLFAPPDLPAAPYLHALAYTPVDAVDTTQLAPPVDAVDTTYLAPPVDQIETAQLSSPLEDADTTLLGPRPAPAAGPGSSPSSPSDPGSPRRVKVRVRRKRAGGLSEESDPAQAAVQAPASAASVSSAASAASALANEETAILRPLQSAPQSSASSLTLNIVSGSQTAQLVKTDTPPVPPAPDQPETTLLTLPATVAASAAETATVSPALEASDAPPVEEPAADADTEPLSPPAAAGEHASAAPDAATGKAPAPVPPAPVVTTRKLPTLAVMAALASRAEARAEAAEAEAREDSNERDVEQASVYASERGSDPGASLADEDTDKLRIPFAATTPADTASVSDPAPSLWTAERDTVAPQNTPSDALPETPFLSGLRDLMGSGPPTQPRPRPGASPRQTPGLAPSESTASVHAGETSAPTAGAEGAEATGPAWRMWWQTATERDQAGRASRPPSMSAPSMPSAASMPSMPPGWRGRASGGSQPLAGARATRMGAPAPRWAASGARGAVQEPTGWGGYTAYESDPGAPLVWTGGVQAALAGMAALIAALALLNGGPRALGVFAWAISFALLAGIGAGLGHLAWRARQPKRATLAITLSHLGLLVWGLALLGPLPALMALAPVTLALTLRGLGRMVTAITAAAVAAFYLVALALSAAGQWPFASGAPSPLILTLLNGVLIVAGVALSALALMTLYAGGARERARQRASARDATLATSELETLRAQTEDDAEALRRALSAALRGHAVESVRARGALSPLAEQVNITGERLAELSYDREARKRLEGATRRLIRNMERAWLGLSWEWPEASGVILDDLVALLRTPPPTGAERLPEDSASTGQVVAPHLYRAGQPGASIPSIPSQPLTAQPGLWPGRSQISQPSGVWPALWPSDPEPAQLGVDPLALPPAPRWGELSDPQRTPRPPSAPSFPYQSALDGESDEYGDQDGNGSSGWNGMNGANSANGHDYSNGERLE